MYNPLVITAGTTPAAAPVVPTIPRGSQVIIDVGFNGTNLVLEGRGARQGNCVDALGQSVIGQVSACNAVELLPARQLRDRQRHGCRCLPSVPPRTGSRA